MKTHPRRIGLSLLAAGVALALGGAMASPTAASSALFVEDPHGDAKDNRQSSDITGLRFEIDERTMTVAMTLATKPFSLSATQAQSQSQKRALELPVPTTYSASGFFRDANQPSNLHRATCEVGVVYSPGSFWYWQEARAFKMSLDRSTVFVECDSGYYGDQAAELHIRGPVITWVVDLDLVPMVRESGSFLGVRGSTEAGGLLLGGLGSDAAGLPTDEVRSDEAWGFS